MKNIFYILLSFVSFQGFAQSYAENIIIDSLYNELAKKGLHDTTYVNLLSDIGEKTPIFRISYWDTIANLSKKALGTQPPSQISKVFNISLADSYNNIGYIHQQKGEIPLALEYYNKALKIQEEIDDKYGMADSYNNIGFIHNKQENRSLALLYYNKALKIQEEIDDKEGLATSCNNIGFIYDEQEDIPLAIEYYNKALRIREEMGDKYRIANSYNNLGAMYDLQGKSLLALEYHNRSLKIKEDLEDKHGMAESYNNIGFIYDKQGEIPLALAYGLKSLAIAQEIAYPDKIKNAAELLGSIYIKQGKGMKALEMYKLYITMRDSIYNKVTQKASAQQQAKYEYEKQKALDDADNDKKVALEREKQKKQFIVLVIIIIASCLVLLLLLIIYRRLRITKKQKVIIEEAHREITDSINYAERIQRSFLATDDLLNENLDDYFVFFQPKEAVSGDFYWARKLPDNNFAMINADSTGHGVPGAIMSILNISSVEKAVEKGFTKPAEIFNDTRKTIIERLKKDGSEEGGKDGMDASIISFDFKNNKFTYTAAQNPIWIIRNSKVIQIKPEKMPIGKHDNDNIPFVGGEFKTQKGDVVYTLTDGYQDQFGGPKGKKFMVKKMREYILSISHLPMQEQHLKIKETFNTWKGDLEQIDDACVIGVRI